MPSQLHRPYTWHMTASESATSLLAGLSNELADAVERVGRSVVAVNARRRMPGSGLAWSSDRVVTAAHVIERDTDLSITAPDGAQHGARLLGRDLATGLAILGVSNAALTPIERATSADIRAGHLVLAIGRPGTPGPIASFGAISSIGGAWRTAQGGVVDAYVRADVSLLPGLSGGALADVRGRVVGLLNAQLAGGDPVAIPTATADGLVQRMLSGGSLVRAYLGVSTQPVELQETLRQRLGLSQASGLMLLGLEPGAPAERAGLLLGDIVLAIGDRTIEDGEALQMALGPEAVGRSTTMRIIRGGQLVQVGVIPGERPR
jgi:S1-C subfamily serine protease